MKKYSLVNLSTIKKSFGRLDAEFFKPEYLIVDNKIEKGGYRPLHSSLKKIDVGHVGSMVKHYTDDGIPLIQTQNIGEFFVNMEDCIHITKKFHDKLGKSKIYKGDILIARSGSFGKASVFYEEKEINSADIIIVQIKEEVYNRDFISAFLNCKYGSKQLIRFASGGVQGHVNLTILEYLKLPVIPRDVQDSIGLLVSQSYESLGLSKKLYHDANLLLEHTLGLDKLKFLKPKSYTAKFNEVVNDKRMNAEYYHPTVRNILAAEFLSDAYQLRDIFEIVRGKTPVAYLEKGIPVIKTKAIRVPKFDETKIEDHADSVLGLTEIKMGDLLFAAMGVGSLGRISYVFEKERDFVIDGTLRVLRKKPNAPENISIPTLLFLSSRAGQELIYRGIVGSTGIISLPDDCLAKIPIPKFENSFASRMTDLVIASVEAKNKSEALLKEAKHKVEQLIEEAAAKHD